MFWAQIEDSSINDLLVKEEVNLEEVLDHESLLQECRIQNDGLIKFFIEEYNYFKLLKHVLNTPTEDYEENIRFKYSSLSCEVLTSDIPALNSLLIKGFVKSSGKCNDFIGFERPYFDQFFDLLSSNDTINPLTISFCIKILLNLLKFDNDSIMKSMNVNRCIDVFLNHVDSNAIIHFFTEFIQCEDDVEVRKQWLADNKFVLKIANLLGVTEYKNNSVQVLLSNIIGYMSQGLTNKSICLELTSQFNEKTFLERLFFHISNPTSDSSLVSTCLKVLKNIVEMQNKIKEDKLNCCIELIQKSFDSFINLLHKPPKQMYDLMPTTVGEFQPFGPTRIEVVYLMESLLRNESKEINSVFIESRILDKLLTLIFEYKWNSQFHLGLLRVLHIILSDVSVGNTYYDLQKYLIQVFGIYRWFFKLYDTMETLKPRPGYSGIMWKIGNLLDSLKNSGVTNDLLAGDSDITEKWQNLVTLYLEPKNAYSEKKPMKIDNGMRELELDLNIINETDIEVSSSNPDAISDYFRDKSENLEDIFGASLLDNTGDEWVSNNVLEMPCAPTDDFVNSSIKEPFDSDDSTSSDEESPAVIRQNPKGNAAKYILSDLHNSNSDLNDLPDIPDSSDVEFSSLEFNDPWELKPSNSLVQDNWAQF